MDRRNSLYSTGATALEVLLRGSSGAASLSPISMESAAFEWNTRSTSSAAEALSLVAKAAKARVGIDFISSAMLHSRAMTGSAAQFRCFKAWVDGGF